MTGDRKHVFVYGALLATLLWWLRSKPQEPQDYNLLTYRPKARKW
jgi:hypothetical protein